MNESIPEVPKTESKEAVPAQKTISFISHDGPYIGHVNLLKVPENLDLNAEREKYRAARDADPTKHTKEYNAFRDAGGSSFAHWLLSRRLATLVEDDGSSIVEDEGDDRDPAGLRY